MTLSRSMTVNWIRPTSQRYMSLSLNDERYSSDRSQVQKIEKKVRKVED